MPATKLVAGAELCACLPAAAWSPSAEDVLLPCSRMVPPADEPDDTVEGGSFRFSSTAIVDGTVGPAPAAQGATPWFAMPQFASRDGRLGRIAARIDIRTAAAEFEGLLHEAMSELARERPAFYNEADLQLAFAWRLKLLRADVAIRLEVPLVEADVAQSRRRLDVLVRVDRLWVAVELKFPRGVYEWRSPTDPVPYRRTSRDAADDTVYNVVEDLSRTERWVEIGAAHLSFVVVLTNNIRMLWRPVTGSTALDIEFRFPEGAELTGVRHWREGGREKPPITLRGRYVAHWRDYSDLAGGRRACTFRYVVLRPLD